MSKHKKFLGYSLAFLGLFMVSDMAIAAQPATPNAWTMYAMKPSHNAFFASEFPAVSWYYTVPDAKLARASGILNNTIIRDLVGFGIGVSVVGGTVYASNNDGYLYALDAYNGHLLWRFQAFNQLMGTPIVATMSGRRLVFVGAGNSVFSYSHAIRFGQPGARVIRGNDLSAIFAVDAETGKRVWVYPTQGEDMPTPVFYQNKLLFGNGDGHVYALNAATGKLLWKTDIGSFVSMSSATLDPKTGILVMGGTHPSRIYGLDATNGKLLWSVAPPHLFSSSAGDGTWAIRGKLAIGQIETRVGQQMHSGISSSEELAINIKTGKIVWSTLLGNGKTPPRNKDAVPTIVGGVIYTGSPVTHHEYAVNLDTGKLLWSQPLPSGMKAAPTVVNDVIIQPGTSGAIFTLNEHTGKILHTYNAHQGGYGPQNGVIIGKTFFIGTNAGTLQAIPLPQLDG